MSALARAAAFFVGPAAERPAAWSVAAAPPEAAAVLGPLGDALPVAAVLGTLMAVWDPDSPHACVNQCDERPNETVAVATPAARRLARWAADRGHDAVARGRTVRVELGAQPRHVVAEIARLAGSADARVVTVLAGPRDPAFDAFLAEQDRVVVVTRSNTDPDLIALALAGLGAAAVAVPALTGPTRLLAAAGWLRRDLTELVVPA